MGDGDRKPPGNNNRHEHEGDSHPQFTSLTLRARLHGQVRGLGAFLAHTKVAYKIVSLRDMCGIEPPGRAIAASAASISGNFFVFRAIHVGTLQLHFRFEL